MTTLGTAVDQMLRKYGLGLKIPNGSFTLSSSTTVTATDYFRSSTRYSNNSFQSWTQWRPAANTSADYIRTIASLAPATGIYTIDATVADTTATGEDIYLLPPWLRPQWIIDAANFALEKNYVANIEPISNKPIGTGLADAGFQSSSTALYTASGSTFSKHTTANSERVYQGLGSGRTLNAGYIMQQHAATEGEPVYVYAVVSVAVGTATLILRDATNSEDIGDTVSSTDRSWTWLVKRETVPTSGASQTVLVEPRFGVTAASDDAYWGLQCTLFPNRNRMILDTKWDSDYKATELVAAKFGGLSPAAGSYQANAGDFIPIPKSDYSLHMERAGPNPTTIIWHNDAQRHWYQYPVMIDGRRAYSDFTTALTLASWATDVPGLDKDLWAAWIGQELLGMDDVLAADGNNLRRLAKANWDAQTTASQFHKTSTTRGRQFGSFGMVRN